MYRLNLNRQKNLPAIKKLILKWDDDSKSVSPLIIVKISRAFSMYHQVSSADLKVHHQSWNHLHPILINDLDNNQNVLLILDTNGKIIHFDLIDDQGYLQRNDRLRNVAERKNNQEYLDYFYLIAKNIESCVNSRNP